jgi:hypothetical protein
VNYWCGASHPTRQYSLFLLSWETKVTKNIRCSKTTVHITSQKLNDSNDVCSVSNAMRVLYVY